MTTETNSSPPALFNLQYPNCQRGMFSFRRPFLNTSTPVEPIRTEESRKNLTSRRAHPEYLQMDQNFQKISTQSFHQDAQTQCSLPMIDNRDEIVFRRHPNFVSTRSPRYRVQLQLQPARPNIYQVWEVNTPPARTLPPANARRLSSPRVRLHSARLVNIRSLNDDFSSDETDDDGILYARYCPQSTCARRNVRCVCMRRDAETISY